MSDEQAKSPLRASKTKEPRVGPSSKTGSSKKTALLLAGAAALALLVGGGYYAWKIAPSSQATDNTASFSTPSAYNETTGTDATTEKAAATAAPAEAQTLANVQTQQKKSRVAAAAIPEETIGVSRVAARANQTDELVVTGRRPIWRYMPTAERLSEYYPEFARDRGREGEARLHCLIGDRGKLDCERVSETPAKAGFGAAALQVAHRLRHADRRADGKSAIGTPINLRVVFRMPEAERRRG